MTDPSVVTIVLNWNGAAVTVDCLRHVARQTLASYVVVIDNASTDHSLGEIEASGLSNEIIRLPTNMGFASGMNVGIRRALEMNFQLVWLLNNDAFVEDNCLEILYQYVTQAPSLAMATPLLFTVEGREQHAGGVIDWAALESTTRTAEELVTSADSVRWLTGTAVLVRAEALEQVGMFDSRFFAYWEDVDLSLRLSKAGYDLRAVPSARATHIGSAASGGSPSPFFQFLMTRNLWLLVRNHRPARALPGAWMMFVSHAIARAGLLHAEGHHDTAMAPLRAIAAAFRGRFGKPEFKTRRLVLLLLVARHPWPLVRCLQAMARLTNRCLRADS